MKLCECLSFSPDMKPETVRTGETGGEETQFSLRVNLIQREVTPCRASLSSALGVCVCVCAPVFFLLLPFYRNTGPGPGQPSRGCRLSSKPNKTVRFATVTVNTKTK